MILGAFLQAAGQLADRRFRRVVGLGLLLALALLFAAYLLFLQLIWWVIPDTMDLPVIGPISGVDSVLGWASLFVMLGLSVFLMVPVASAFTGLFLEDVAAAVEDRHFPALPAPSPMPLAESLRQSVNFLGVVVAVNAAGLFVYPVLGPGAPLAFWAVNGFLLGREYFSLVALRRLPQHEVKAMRRRNRWTLWVAGTLMAVPLSFPLVNLVVPVLGVATFTLLFHRLALAGR